MLNRETVGDDSEKKAKTSIRITRAVAEDVSVKVKKVMKYIEDPTKEENKLDFSYSDWTHFVTATWSDKIKISAVNKAISKMMRKKYSLNTNECFLDLIFINTFPELKKEFESAHPIAGLSYKDAIDKKPKKTETRRKYEDLWLTPKELQEKYKEN